MKSTRIELFREALDLNERDRATLAGLLIESLEHEPDENIDRLWAAEVERRIHELGTVLQTRVPAFFQPLPYSFLQTCRLTLLEVVLCCCLPDYLLYHRIDLMKKVGQLIPFRGSTSSMSTGSVNFADNSCIKCC